jgi:hypothetical protein
VTTGAGRHAGGDVGQPTGQPFESPPVRKEPIREELRQERGPVRTWPYERARPRENAPARRSSQGDATGLSNAKLQSGPTADNSRSYSGDIVCYCIENAFLNKAAANSTQWLSQYYVQRTAYELGVKLALSEAPL